MALPEVLNGSGGPPSGPDQVGRPFRMTGTCRETFLEVRDRSEAFQEIWMVLLVIRVALLEARNGSGGHPKGLGCAGRPTRRSGPGWEAVLEVWEWSGVSPRSPRLVGMPLWRSGMGREAI